MKRLISIVLMLIIVYSLASCKKESSTKPPHHDAPNAPTYEIKKLTDDIISNKKDCGDITLLYPELEGYEDANSLILDIVKRNCTESLPNLSSYEDGNIPEVTYEISSFSFAYLSETFLSAKVQGTLTVSLAPHPSPFVYALNVDLEELRELDASDIVSNFDKIKNLFKNGEFTLEQGDEAMLRETNYEDMIMQYRSEYEIYPQMYFSGEKLYMNIELVYSLGSNALYSIKLDDIRDCLKIENKEISKIIK